MNTNVLNLEIKFEELHTFLFIKACDCNSVIIIKMSKFKNYI